MGYASEVQIFKDRQAQKVKEKLFLCWGTAPCHAEMVHRQSLHFPCFERNILTRNAVHFSYNIIPVFDSDSEMKILLSVDKWSQQYT
jgi:hypothetical protein